MLRTFGLLQRTMQSHFGAIGISASQWGYCERCTGLKGGTHTVAAEPISAIVAGQAASITSVVTRRIEWADRRELRTVICGQNTSADHARQAGRRAGHASAWQANQDGDERPDGMNNRSTVELLSVLRVHLEELVETVRPPASRSEG